MVAAAAGPALPFVSEEEIQAVHENFAQVARGDEVADHGELRPPNRVRSSPFASPVPGPAEAPAFGVDFYNRMHAILSPNAKVFPRG